MNKYIVEFIGTFFLVLAVVITVNAELDMAPLAIGAVLTGMIYAGYHISGAQYNPAVTLAVIITGKMKTSDVAGYLSAQFLAAIAAALIGTKLLGMTPAASPTAMNLLPGISAEILGTFAIVWVILHTATTDNTAGNSYYGLAIGFTVMGCAWILGSWSGGYFNPAVGIGALVAGMTTISNLGTILLANIIGGIIAAYAFKAVYDKN